MIPAQQAQLIRFNSGIPLMIPINRPPQIDGINFDGCWFMRILQCYFFPFTWYYSETFYVNPFRNALWFVGGLVVVGRMPYAVSEIQLDCHSLENLCNCVIIPAVKTFFRRNSHIRLRLFQFFRS